MSEEQTKPVEETPETTNETGDQATASTLEAQAERIAALEAALAQSEKQARDFSDGWQRERADFANYKKRIERDMSDIRQTSTQTALLALLPVIDDFERAVGSVPDDLKDHPWLEGVTAIQRKLERILSDQGMVAIDPVGQPFDPNLHEAVSVDATSDAESGHVTATLQKGYRSGDRILRPALVRVAG